jgi:thiol-disulfide isomerase/thioredoxin
MKLNTNKITSPIMSNPLVIIIFLILALIVILAIIRPASPFLNFGLGLNAHIGDLKGSFQIEAFDNNSSPEFVMYYAEWCGHCKRAKPEFTKLMESYNGPIKLSMIDCEENKEIAEKQQIKGFPTIRYYPNGANLKEQEYISNYQEYSGGRTHFDFNQHLDKVTGVLDKEPDNAAPVM